MRKLLILAATLLILCGCVSTRPRGNAGHFTILQVNDVYKVEGLEGGTVGGLARLRTLRRELEADRDVVVVHAGDVLFPSVMSKYLLAQPMVRCLNLLDGDAAARDERLLVCFGNHEFDHKDPGVVLGRVAQSDFTWLGTNLGYRTSPGAPVEPFSARLTNVRATEVLELGGIRAGFFSLILDDQQRDYVGYEYDIAARNRIVRKSIDELRRAGASVLVAVTHQDMTEDVRLARDFPEIDVIAGGHEHFYQSRQVGRTWITKADADVKSAIVLDVVTDGLGGTTVTPRKVEVDASIAEDATMRSEAERWLEVLSSTIQRQTGVDPDTVYATTRDELEGVEPAVRGRETAMGNLLADIMCERMGAEIALVNGGAIRINDNIPAGGDVTGLDLEGIFYFDNRIVLCELTGQEILDCLRASVSGVHLGKGGFFQVSGLEFAYHVGGSADEPTYRVEPGEVMARQGGAGKRLAPLDLRRRYRVTTLDYIWENGHRDGYAVFSHGGGGTSPPRLDDGGADWRQTTVEALRALPGGQITTAIEGRIRRVE